MAKMSFMEIVDSIFINKSRYHHIPDQDKIDAFYLINKKFYFADKEFAISFNDKSLDKASALDLWFIKFKDIRNTPAWYWLSKKREAKESKDGKKLSQKDKDIIMQYIDLSERDIDFLHKYYPEDLKNELKKAKKFYGE